MTHAGGTDSEQPRDSARPRDPDQARDPGLPREPEQPQYPQQQLLPQQVASRRSRKPWFIVAGVVVLALIAGLVVWRLTRDEGEQTRAAYCATLKRATHGGDLAALVSSSAGARPLATLNRLHGLAPATVKPAWDDLYSLLGQVRRGRQPDLSSGLQALSDLKRITNDANANCGLTIQLPGGL